METLTPALTVVTAVIGTQTDRLKDPRVVPPHVRFLCLTDQPLRSRVWEIQAIPPSSTPIWTAREIKLRLHQYVAGDTLWLDASFQLWCDPRSVAARLAQAPLVMFPHPERTTIRAEAETILRCRMVSGDGPLQQACTYMDEGLPAIPPLASTGFLLRRGDPAIAAFNEYWWQELRRWDHPRDQMSVNYAAWRTGVPIAWLPGTYRSNAYAVRTKRPSGLVYRRPRVLPLPVPARRRR